MMSKGELGFNKYHGICTEGFIGGEQQEKCKILFVLREPNSKGKPATDFWFKNIIENKVSDPESKRIGTKYINVFDALARKILGEEYNNYKDKTDLFKECCYVNMLNVGESSVSEGYKALAKAMKTTGVNPECEKILKDRKNVIKRLIDYYGCRHIVTVSEIFDYLCPNPEIGCLKYNGKVFKEGEYESAKVYEFYHPSARISYEKLNKSLFSDAFNE